MKLLGNCLLSLLLLAMPLWCSPAAAASGPSGWAREDVAGLDACCRPAAGKRCQAHCCVGSPETPASRVPLKAMPVGPTGKVPLPTALFFALWQLPASPVLAPAVTPPASAGAVAPHVPLFLRHATLLI